MSICLFTFCPSRLCRQLSSAEEDGQQDDRPSRRVSAQTARSVSNPRSHFLQSAVSFRGIQTVLRYFLWRLSFHFFKFPRIIFCFRRGRKKVLPDKKWRWKKLFTVSNARIWYFYNISFNYLKPGSQFCQIANCV